MTSLWLAYLALTAGLMTFGGILVWLGLRRPPPPASVALRRAITVSGLVALAGAVAAALLEAGAVRP